MFNLSDDSMRVLARVGARERSMEDINSNPQFTLCTLSDPCLILQQCPIDHDGC